MKRIFTIAILIVLLASQAQVSLALAEATVEPANMQGWGFAQESGTTGTGFGDFVPGPGTAPLGAGSARLVVDDNGRWLLFNNQFSGTRLDQLTALSYGTYRVRGGDALAITLQFDMDFDLSDADTSWQGRLVFEPYLTATVQTGAWQTWQPMTGKWYATRAPYNGLCPMSAPCTFTQVLTNWPNAGLRANNLGFTYFKAGGPWTGGFEGNIDAFTIGINGTDTTFNFEPAATVYVDDDWAALAPGADPDGTGPAHAMGLDAFAKIQQGVDAVAAGGTVNVAAGTYLEQVTIKHPLTLTGAGADQTTVQAPTYANRTRLARIGRIFDYVVGTVDADGVVVEGLTVDAHREGAPTCVTNERAAGVFFIGSNATLQDASVIDAAQADAQFGCQSSAWSGVLGIGDSAPAVNHVTVRNVTVDRFQKNGITAYAATPGGLDVLIDGNTVNAVHESRTAQNGIQVSSGAGGVVSDNTINNVFYTGTTPYVASALLVMYNAPVTVQDNTILNSQVGVYLYGGGGTLDGNTVTSALPANFTGQFPYYGLIVTDPPGVVPSPVDAAPTQPAPASVSQAAGAVPQVAAALDIAVTDNVLTGASDDPNTIGIEADAGYDAFDTNITITGNVVRGWGYGIAASDCTSGCTTSKFLSINANFNKIAGNEVGLSSATIIPINAENNWWGCNAGPNDAAGKCDTVETSASSGAVDTNPWLVLTLTVDVPQVLPGQPGLLQVALTTNSDGTDTSGLGSFVDVGNVDFTTTAGTLSAASVPLAGNAANSTLSVTKDASHTLATITATYDNQVLTLDLGVGFYKIFAPFIGK